VALGQLYRNEILALALAVWFARVAHLRWLDVSVSALVSVEATFPTVSSL